MRAGWFAVAVAMVGGGCFPVALHRGGKVLPPGVCDLRTWFTGALTPVPEVGTDSRGPWGAAAAGRCGLFPLSPSKPLDPVGSVLVGMVGGTEFLYGGIIRLYARGSGRREGDPWSFVSYQVLDRADWWGVTLGLRSPAIRLWRPFRLSGEAQVFRSMEGGRPRVFLSGALILESRLLREP